jgi:ubiquinone/menaquinone biosynthesis C-methylase UbiE
MEMFMQRPTDEARFWDRTARRYAADPIKDLVGYNRTIDRTCELLDPTDVIVEIGCGTGMTALKLAPFVFHIVASDVSSEMIAIAREKALAEACTNVTFKVAAASGLEQADDSCDAVLAFNLLHLVVDRPALLDRIFRMLKPGGLLISKTPCLSEMNPLIRLVVPVMRLAGKAPFVAAFSAHELEYEMADAGFTIVDRERHGSGRKDARIFMTVRKPATMC